MAQKITDEETKVFIKEHLEPILEKYIDSDNSPEVRAAIKKEVSAKIEEYYPGEKWELNLYNTEMRGDSIRQKMYHLKSFKDITKKL